MKQSSLQHKPAGLQWDGVENKTSVAVYAGGAVVLLWLSSTIVSAVNAVPVVRPPLHACGGGRPDACECACADAAFLLQLPKLLELVGLGYSAWFVYRYLLFKVSRNAGRVPALALPPSHIGHPSTPDPVADAWGRLLWLRGYPCRQPSRSAADSLATSACLCCPQNCPLTSMCFLCAVEPGGAARGHRGAQEEGHRRHRED